MRCLIAFSLLLPGLLRAGDVDYARDVLPILSENCYHCHGPDDGSRKAGLRLDTKEGAFKERKRTTTIVPGKSQESELVARILAEGDDAMPPPESNRKLTAKQKETLKKWVDEGAKWGTHWSLVSLPKQVPVPKDHANPIDAFIRQALAKQGLTHAPPSTKEAWLRRITFDLTGLPPTLSEIDSFVNDQTPQAYEKVVDRLLKSPRYGERMASDWLDLARFADTYGYQHDRPSPMWPYRDWVINAFNNNMRYDAFLTHQLAGDLLKDANQQSRLATAFNRLHMQNEEGGIVEEEFRVAYVSDRVNTFGTAFLAQTFECCRCHDHKYDPLSQKDYYSLFSFFQNIPEAGQTSYFTNAMNTPTLLLTTPEQAEKIELLKREIEQKRMQLIQAKNDAIKNYNPLMVIDPKKLLPDRSGSFIMKEFDGKQLINKTDPNKSAKPHGPLRFSNGKIELDGENGMDFPELGHFRRSDPFTILVEIECSNLPDSSVIFHHTKAPIDAGHRGYELTIEGKKLAFSLVHMWPGNAAKIRTKSPVNLTSATMIAVSSDGSGTAAGMKIWVNGLPAVCEIVRDSLSKDIHYGGQEPTLALGYRFRDRGLKHAKVSQLQVFNREISAFEHISLSEIFYCDFDKSIEFTREYKALVFNDEVRKAQSDLNTARKTLADFVEPIPEIMVMDELPQPKPAFVLKRGAYDQYGDPVSMNTPAAMPAFKDYPRNRLGLAQWMTANDHPLTARVQVNRLWQQMFGKGLVETSDNFGTTGSMPTHPELLDWLARDFVDHGWDIQHTLKMIALSETYRQSSRTSKETREKDPNNQWLARAPVRRLTAEMLRDQALAQSGLLHEKLGGPSVYPVQPAGLWNDAMGKPKYPQSKGPDLHRRSLYTFWKRTAPPPGMTTFDAADRSNCTARRQSTSTPLQALVLLNDPQYVEAARALAELAMKQEIPWAFRTVTSRTPSEAELKVMTLLLDEQRAIYKADPTAAGKLLQTKTPDPELAAYTQLMLALLNLDAAVHCR